MLAAAIPLQLLKGLNEILSGCKVENMDGFTHNTEIVHLISS